MFIKIIDFFRGAISIIKNYWSYGYDYKQFLKIFNYYKNFLIKKFDKLF